MKNFTYIVLIDFTSSYSFKISFQRFSESSDEFLEIYSLNNDEAQLPWKYNENKPRRVPQQAYSRLTLLTWRGNRKKNYDKQENILEFLYKNGFMVEVIDNTSKKEFDI